MKVLEKVTNILNDNTVCSSLAQFEYDNKKDRIRFTYKDKKVCIYIENNYLYSSSSAFYLKKLLILKHRQEDADYIAVHIIKAFESKKALQTIKNSIEKSYTLTYTDKDGIKTTTIKAVSSMDALRQFTMGINKQNIIDMEIISINEI